MYMSFALDDGFNGSHQNGPLHIICGSCTVATGFKVLSTKLDSMNWFVIDCFFGGFQRAKAYICCHQHNVKLNNGMDPIRPFFFL